MRRPVPGGRDPHLNVRIGLFFVAAVLLLIGEVTDRRAYAIPAAVIAAAALLLRFFPRGAGDGAGGSTGDADRPAADHDPAGPADGSG